jgi:hypothetical protein
MTWFRKHIKTGSRLALFALLIQLVLTSGHIHLDAAHAAPAGITASLQMPPDDGSAPTHHHAADYCELCAVAALAGTMLFAAPPLLRLPQTVALVLRTTEAKFAYLNYISGAPQPRGPPTF